MALLPCRSIEERERERRICLGELMWHRQRDQARLTSAGRFSNAFPPRHEGATNEECSMDDQSKRGHQPRWCPAIEAHPLRTSRPPLVPRRRQNRNSLVRISNCTKTSRRTNLQRIRSPSCKAWARREMLSLFRSGRSWWLSCLLISACLLFLWEKNWRVCEKWKFFTSSFD